MASFAIIFFFAATGLTLNHPTWFQGSVKTREVHGSIKPAELSNQAAAIQQIRAAQHLHGALGDDTRLDDSQLTFSFRAPGYTADASVDRQTGAYTVTEVNNGFVALLNDLHKGSDSGKAWHTLIDASAILLLALSLTGLTILWFIYKRRASGLLVAAAGAALCLLVYKIFVP